MSSTGLIRLDNDVKQEVEDFRDNRFRVKTHSDAVSMLIQKLRTAEREIERLKKQQLEEKQRKDEEDISLGKKIKDDIDNFKDRLNFLTAADAIDFLICAFDLEPTMNKIAFDLYIQKTRK